MQTKEQTDQYFDNQVSKLKKHRNIVIAIVIIIAIALLATSCKKDTPTTAIFYKGEIVVDYTSQPCQCSKVMRIDSQSFNHPYMNSYYATTSDGVDLDIGVVDIRKANGQEQASYAWGDKASIYVPYIAGKIYLKTDTSFWLSIGMQLNQFDKALHLH